VPFQTAMMHSIAVPEEPKKKKSKKKEEDWEIMSIFGAMEQE
jgi:hypothetical protein